MNNLIIPASRVGTAIGHAKLEKRDVDFINELGKTLQTITVDTEQDKTIEITHSGNNTKHIGGLRVTSTDTDDGNKAISVYMRSMKKDVDISAVELKIVSKHTGEEIVTKIEHDFYDTDTFFVNDIVVSPGKYNFELISNLK